MRVTVNGEPRTVPGPTTVAGLLEQLRARGRLAVELNQRILPRSQWSSRTIADGDRIEVIHAIGGG